MNFVQIKKGIINKEMLNSSAFSLSVVPVYIFKRRKKCVHFGIMKIKGAKCLIQIHNVTKLKANKSRIVLLNILISPARTMNRISAEMPGFIVKRDKSGSP